MINKKVAHYSLLLRKYGPNSIEVHEFEKANKDNRPLMSRINNLKKYFKSRS